MHIGKPTIHQGVCDASAAVFVEVGATRFLVADDEDQDRTMLRLYDASSSGPPLQAFELNNAFLALDPDEPEVDIEGSAWLGKRIFWIGSHSRNKRGKLRPSRHRLFATTMRNGKPAPSGQPYSRLVADVGDAFHLDLDPELAPKDGGLSIEGLSATPSTGELLIALRSPLFKGNALVIPLRNADAVVDDGVRARFGEPVRLDLDRLGIRSLEWWPERQSYYLLAGPAGDSDDRYCLMRWSGPVASRPEALDRIDFANIGIPGEAAAEALLIERRSSTVYVLFDEGNRRVGETKCKDAKRKSFRSVAISGL
jgi:hypothetical protein